MAFGWLGGWLNFSFGLYSEELFLEEAVKYLVAYNGVRVYHGGRISASLGPRHWLVGLEEEHLPEQLILNTETLSRIIKEKPEHGLAGEGVFPKSQDGAAGSELITQAVKATLMQLTLESLTRVWIATPDDEETMAPVADLLRGSEVGGQQLVGPELHELLLHVIP